MAFSIPIWERRRLVKSAHVHKTYAPKLGTQVESIELFRAEIECEKLSQVEVACPICDSTNHFLIAERDRVGLAVQTVLCGNCPTMYSRKRLDEQSLDRFYSHFYRKMYGGHEAPDRGWFVQQSHIGEPIVEWLVNEGLIEPTLCDVTVVEVGAGAGGLLAPFAARGARVIGIDYDEKFLQLGREMGIEMIAGGVDALAQVSNVDIVIMKDVLEHLGDLRHAMETIRSCLSRNGICFIQVPGMQSLRSLGYQNDLLRYLQIAHVVHFTEESLRYLVESCGLEVLSSTRQVRLVCRANLDASQQNEIEQPTNQAAIEALEDIFRTRFLLSVFDHLRPFIPGRVRRFLRRATA